MAHYSSTANGVVLDAELVLEARELLSGIKAWDREGKSHELPSRTEVKGAFSKIKEEIEKLVLKTNRLDKLADWNEHVVSGYFLKGITGNPESPANSPPYWSNHDGDWLVHVIGTSDIEESQGVSDLGVAAKSCGCIQIARFSKARHQEVYARSFGAAGKQTEEAWTAWSRLQFWNGVEDGEGNLDAALQPGSYSGEWKTGLPENVGESLRASLLVMASAVSETFKARQQILMEEGGKSRLWMRGEAGGAWRELASFGDFMGIVQEIKIGAEEGNEKSKPFEIKLEPTATVVMIDYEEEGDTATKHIVFKGGADAQIAFVVNNSVEELFVCKLDKKAYVVDVDVCKGGVIGLAVAKKDVDYRPAVLYAGDNVQNVKIPSPYSSEYMAEIARIGSGIRAEYKERFVDEHGETLTSDFERLEADGNLVETRLKEKLREKWAATSDVNKAYQQSRLTLFADIYIKSGKNSVRFAPENDLVQLSTLFNRERLPRLINEDLDLEGTYLGDFEVNGDHDRKAIALLYFAWFFDHPSYDWSNKDNFKNWLPTQSTQLFNQHGLTGTSTMRLTKVDEDNLTLMSIAEFVQHMVDMGKDSSFNEKMKEIFDRCYAEYRAPGGMVETDYFFDSVKDKFDNFTTDNKNNPNHQFKNADISHNFYDRDVQSVRTKYGIGNFPPIYNDGSIKDKQATSVRSHYLKTFLETPLYQYDTRDFNTVMSNGGYGYLNTYDTKPCILFLELNGDHLVMNGQANTGSFFNEHFRLMFVDFYARYFGEIDYSGFEDAWDEYVSSPEYQEEYDILYDFMLEAYVEEQFADYYDSMKQVVAEELERRTIEAFKETNSLNPGFLEQLPFKIEVKKSTTVLNLTHDPKDDYERDADGVPLYNEKGKEYEMDLLQIRPRYITISGGKAGQNFKILSDTVKELYVMKFMSNHENPEEPYELDLGVSVGGIIDSIIIVPDEISRTAALRNLLSTATFEIDSDISEHYPQATPENTYRMRQVTLGPYTSTILIRRKELTKFGKRNEAVGIQFKYGDEEGINAKTQRQLAVHVTGDTPANTAVQCRFGNAPPLTVTSNQASIVVLSAGSCMNQQLWSGYPMRQS
jgi:hypothetical protein